MTKGTSRASRVSDFIIPSSFVIRHSSFSAQGAFTVLELLVVITIIVTLAGLILATTGYVQKKGGRSRAESEIDAMSAGIYVRNSDTDNLDPINNVNPSATPLPNNYTKASLYLYEQLSGDSTGNRQPSGKSYFTFKPNMLLPAPPSTATVIAIRDPFGNSYGYSTMKASNPTNNGYNPTFDLWSTAGGTQSGNVPGWVKNW